MTPQTGQQIITIHILSNISRTKANQAMKFGQLINYSARIIFLQNHAEIESGTLVLDLLLYFKKTLYKV